MKEYNIAMCGAFNVYSYGDCLFPVALEEELKKRNIKIQLKLFSPCIGGKLYYDGRTVYSYEQLEEENNKQRIDLIVVGGGELLHLKKIAFKDKNGMPLIYNEGEIWEKPIEFSQKNDIKCIINGVGVPYDFSVEEGKLVQNYLESIPYISVRDIYSQKRLQNIGISNVLIPDTLWNINDYFHGKDLKKEKYIVVQYGAQNQKEKLLEIINDRFVRAGYKVILLSINYCHEDSALTRDFERYTTENVKVLNERLSVNKIYELISGSSLFIGTSLHGTLTAVSSGVPAIIIDMYPEVVGKMDGLAEWLGNEVKMISDIQSLTSVNMEKCNKPDLSAITEKVQNHFDDIVKYLI